MLRNKRLLCLCKGLTGQPKYSHPYNGEYSPFLYIMCILQGHFLLNMSCYHKLSCPWTCFLNSRVSLMRYLSSVCPETWSREEPLIHVHRSFKCINVEILANELHQFHNLQLLEKFSSIQMLSVHHSQLHALPIQKETAHLISVCPLYVCLQTEDWPTAGLQMLVSMMWLSLRVCV